MTTKAKGATLGKCTCRHDFQDARYGRGMRVFNIMKPDTGAARCTVCSRVVKLTDLKDRRDP